MNSRDEVYPFIDDFISSHSDIKKIAFSDGVTLYQLGLFDYIKNKYPTYDINQPLERGAGGHYKVFGEQPPGRMNLPYEEWKEKNDSWYEKV